MAFFKPGYKPAEVTKSVCSSSSNEKCKRETKGSMVGLSTFISWGKEHVLGHETIEDKNKKQLVNFMWCKVYKQAIRKHTDLKGQELESALKMAHGTNFVTK